MLFHGPCIDSLGSVVILRGGEKPELHQRQKTTIEKESKTLPSCNKKKRN